MSSRSAKRNRTGYQHSIRTRLVSYNDEEMDDEGDMEDRSAQPTRKRRRTYGEKTEKEAQSAEQEEEEEEEAQSTEQEDTASAEPEEVTAGDLRTPRAGSWAFVTPARTSRRIERHPTTGRVQLLSSPVGNLKVIAEVDVPYDPNPIGDYFPELGHLTSPMTVNARPSSPVSLFAVRGEKITEDQLCSAIHVLEDRQVTVSLLLDALVDTTNTNVKMQVGRWLRGNKVKGLVERWAGRSKWAMKQVQKDVAAEGRRAENSGRFGLPPKEFTNEAAGSLSLEDLANDTSELLPITTGLMNILIHPRPPRLRRRAKKTADIPTHFRMERSGLGRHQADARAGYDTALDTAQASESQSEEYFTWSDSDVEANASDDIDPFLDADQRRTIPSNPPAIPSDTPPSPPASPSQRAAYFRDLDLDGISDAGTDGTGGSFDVGGFWSDWDSAEDADDEDEGEGETGPRDPQAQKKPSRQKPRTRSRRFVVAWYISCILYCRNSALNKAQRGMGLMLWSTRTSVRVIGIFNKLGISQSYQTIQRNVERLSEDARDILEAIIKDESIPKALLYDNLNFLEGVKVQTTTHHDKMRSAVVGNILVMDAEVALPSADHPVVSDTLFLHVMGPGVKRPTVEPVLVCPDGMRSLQRVPRPPTDGTLEEIDMSLYLPTDEQNQHLLKVMAIHLVHGFIDANPTLESLRETVPAPPAIYPLKNKKSTLYPVPLQNVDEAKIDGQREYFEATLLHHLRLDSEFFRNLVMPMYGDNLTVDRIRLLSQQMLEDTTTDPFLKAQFMEPFFGALHLGMAMVQSFFRENAGTEKHQDTFSLHHTKHLLEKRNLKLDNPEYFEGDLFIRKHVSAFAQVLIGEELPDAANRRDANNMAIGFDTEAISMDRLMQIAADIVEKYTKPPIEVAQQGSEPLNHLTWDTVHLHGQSVLRHALIHMELRHAVKRGDPGRMVALFPYLCAMFKATGKHKYANEILEIQTRFKSEWNVALRVGMIGHSLVNTSGRPDGWIGIDHYQEHDVRTHKVDFPLHEQRKEGNANHKKVGGILHTIKNVKNNFFHRFQLCGLKTSKAKISIAQEVYTLSKSFFVDKVTHWNEGRRSDAYQTYEGEMKEYIKQTEPEEAKAKLVGIATDPLAKGFRLLTVTSTGASVKAYLQDRIWRVTHSLDLLIKAVPSESSSETAALDGDDNMEDEDNNEEEGDEEMYNVV